jgi:hypothetical protein
MSTTTTPIQKPPFPYRAALESGDPVALAAALHPDAIFDAPGFDEPVEGRDNVIAFLAALAGNSDGLQFIDEFWGDGYHVLIFLLSVDGSHIQGADYIQLDPEGLVKRVTVMARPLRLLQELTNRLVEAHARLTAVPL